MKINWTVCCAVLLVLTLTVSPWVEAGEVLNGVKRDCRRSGGLRRAESPVVASAFVGGAPNPPYVGRTFQAKMRIAAIAFDKQ